jgi:hypothetical protein
MYKMNNDILPAPLLNVYNKRSDIHCIVLYLFRKTIYNHNYIITINIHNEYIAFRVIPKANLGCGPQRDGKILLIITYIKQSQGGETELIS